jgi:hypothetical protein
VRLLQQTVRAEALGERALGVAHRAGQQPGHGLDDQARSDLSSVQDDVADAQLTVDQVLAHAVVDALVPAAQELNPSSRSAREPVAWSKRRPPGPSR